MCQLQDEMGHVLDCQKPANQIPFNSKVSIDLDMETMDMAVESHESCLGICQLIYVIPYLRVSRHLS